MAGVVLAVAGCGGDGDRPAAPAPEPTIQGALARDLAARSERIADRLARREGCGAARAAVELQRRTIAAINDGRVPGALQEDLLSSVNLIAESARCRPGAKAPPAGGGDAEREARALAGWLRARAG